MTTPQPQGLPPQTFAEWPAQPVDFDMLGPNITHGSSLSQDQRVAAEYGWNAAAREALRAQAAICIDELSRVRVALGLEAQDADADPVAVIDMLRSWEADATQRAQHLAEHLSSVLEVARTWQPDYATRMDRDTLEHAAKAVGGKRVAQAASVEPYGQITTHTETGQQFFYRWPQSPYLDNASECVTVYAGAPPAQAASVEPVAYMTEDGRTLKGMAEAVAHLPDPWCEPAQADAASEAFTGIANDDDFWTALDAWRENLQAYQPQVQQGGGESTATKLAKRTCEANADAARFTIALQTLRASLDPDDWMGPVTMHAYIDKVLAGGSPLNPDCTLTTKDPK